MNKEEIIKEIERLLQCPQVQLKNPEGAAYSLGWLKGSLEHLLEKLKETN